MGVLNMIVGRVRSTPQPPNAPHSASMRCLLDLHCWAYGPPTMNPLPHIPLLTSRCSHYYNGACGVLFSVRCRDGGPGLGECYRPRPKPTIAAAESMDRRHSPLALSRPPCRRGS